MASVEVSRSTSRGRARDSRSPAVVLTGSKAISAELEELSADYLAVPVNAADRNGAFDLVAQVVDRFGKVDGLVANAQTFRSVTPLADVTAADMDLLFDTGPKGTLWGMQAVFPHMRDQGVGTHRHPGLSRRAARLHRVRAVRVGEGSNPRAHTCRGTRVGSVRIIVNCICPVSIAHRAPPGDDPARVAVYKAAFEDHPLGRDGDAEDDIAPVVSFLLSDACRYVTGETFMVDGGSFMRP